MLCTGRQYTPVDSMATCVTPFSTSQSLSLSKSAVIVPKVWNSLTGCPFGPGTIAQAAMHF
jgi:hypothetical protein